jgi:branched-chain amino acid transport system substrate-binding protein
VRRLPLAISLAVAAALVAGTANGSAPLADPGVSSNEILIGGTVPITGPAAAYVSVGRGAAAYFSYVNDTRNGVNGRKVKYKYVDDGYNPALTVSKTRELVQHDHVFAIFNSLGTEHNIAIRGYLNSVKVPQLFVGSGATTWGKDYKRYPMTIGYLPTYRAEGMIYARHILKTKPKAKVAVLYQSDSYGRDLLAGLERGFGAKKRNIVARQGYEPTATDVSSQIGRLKASKATVFMLIATPRYAIQAFVAANKLGWRPQIYVNQVASASNIMRIAETSASQRAVRGAYTIVVFKDATNPRFANDAGMKLYRRIMARYAPRADVGDVFHVYSMAVAYTLVDVLKKAGRNVTRKAVLNAVRHLNEKGNPFLLKGIRLKTTSTDHFPIEQMQLSRWNGNWQPVGKLQFAR